MPVDTSMYGTIAQPQSTNLLGLAGTFTGVQNQLNQNKLFQQSYNSKLALGQHFKAAVDPETGQFQPDKFFSSAASDPVASVGLPEVWESMQRANASQADAIKTNLETHSKAMSNLSNIAAGMLGAAAAQNRPISMDDVNGQLVAAVKSGTMPAQDALSAHELISKAYDPADPASLNKLILGYADRFKEAADSTNNVLGKIDMINTGGHLVPTQISPQSGVRQVGPSIGLGVTPEAASGIVPNATPQGQAAPRSALPGLVTDSGGFGAGGGWSGGNALGIGPNAGGRGTPAPSPIAAPTPAQSGGNGPSIGATVPPVSPSPGIGPTIGGSAVQGDLAKEYTAGRSRYDSAINVLGNLEQIKNDFKTLNTDPNFLNTGTASEFRGQVAGAANTIAQMFGKEAPFDPAKKGAQEELFKETFRGGAGALSQLLGVQREAASIVSKSIQAFPGAENTPIGAQMIVNSLEEMMKREVDKHNWETNWLQNPSHGGDLTGASEAFNQKFPAQMYANRAISSVLGPDGKPLQPHTVGTAAEAKSSYLPGTFVKTPAGDIVGVPGAQGVPLVGAGQ